MESGEHEEKWRDWWVEVTGQENVEREDEEDG